LQNKKENKCHKYVLAANLNIDNLLLSGYLKGAYEEYSMFMLVMVTSDCTFVSRHLLTDIWKDSESSTSFAFFNLVGS
jgi:hypothetical protein